MTPNSINLKLYAEFFQITIFPASLQFHQFLYFNTGKWGIFYYYSSLQRRSQYMNLSARCNFLEAFAFHEKLSVSYLRKSAS